MIAVVGAVVVAGGGTIVAVHKPRFGTVATKSRVADCTSPSSKIIIRSCLSSYKKYIAKGGKFTEIG